MDEERAVDEESLTILGNALAQVVVRLFSTPASRLIQLSQDLSAAMALRKAALTDGTVMRPGTQKLLAVNRAMIDKVFAMLEKQG